MMGPASSFCLNCGGRLVDRYVPDEERERPVCEVCGYIHYRNPVPVAGTIPEDRGRVWLLRRAIAPRIGFWTFPAGFMELGETVEEAAKRETREELNMEVRLDRLLNVYSYAGHSNVHIVFLATALSQPSIGIEALECAPFAPDAIPWDDLAFDSTRAALRDWLTSRSR